MSVALGDLDGVHGKDIVIALWQPGSVGVMLNHGDGTFGALQQYSAGPECAGQAVEVELGDVTGPAGPFVPDGKLDVYVACTPYVVRLTGDGTGALGNPKAFQLYLPAYLGSPTIDFLALVRRPDGNPAPLLALQHAVASSAVGCASATSSIRSSCSAVPRRCEGRWRSVTSTARSPACRPTRS